MTGQNIYESELFQQCLKFHDHLCSGLSMGFLAATAGMVWLDSHRAEDEEIVTIVETDACGCDAVQVVTGCTPKSLQNNSGVRKMKPLSLNGVRVIAR